MTKLPERNLNLLRAIAVLCVVVGHVAVAFRLPTGDIEWTGRAGVLLFFVHTSLVLMASIERTSTPPHWVRDFYIRRTFRIYPLSIIVVLGMLLTKTQAFLPVQGQIKPYVPPTTAGLVANLALVQDLTGQQPILGVLWTLPIELQMYLVLPFCYLVALKGPRWMAVLLALGLIPAAVYAFASNAIPGVWRFPVLEFVPCFCSGVLAYALLRRCKPRVMSWLWLPLFALVLGCYVLVAHGKNNSPPPVAEWALCVAVGVVISLVRELPASTLTRGAATVATYSYGVYLTHIPALHIVLSVLHRASVAVLVPAFALCCSTLSWLAYHLVEHPGIQLGKRLVQRSQRWWLFPQAEPQPAPARTTD
jgi:peptidoglycan/LPS O-acetylase OafA/YrhL